MLLVFVMTFSAHNLLAQPIPQASDPERFTPKELKQIEKSKKMYLKGKFDKAISLLKVPQSTHLLNSELWSLRVTYEYDRYQAQRAKDSQKGFNSAKGRSLLTEFLTACYLATLYCNDQENAAIMLRIYLVDETVDEDVSKSAVEEFNLGEQAFMREKYGEAARHYKAAWKEDTTYYKAALYVGDAYFRDKDYEQALPWYQRAVRMQPNRLEARKYLTDVFMKLHRWKEAYDACLDGIVVYPDVGMFVKLKDICEEMDKKFDQHWMARFYLPNMVSVEDQAAIPKEPWSFYRKAKYDVINDCDKNGIIDGKEGSLRFLEVYSWDYMLKKASGGSELSFAEKMKNEGYLDCYAFVSMYHVSFHKQYREFARSNAERIKKYIDTYLVTSK